MSFRTLHRECGTPIKQKRWCPFHEREVEPDELVKGWEVAKGEFVLVEESDLESVALQRSQSIDILRFVTLEDVDPVYFDRTYYLAPATAEAQRRPYVLLLRAMQETRDGRGREVRALGQGEPLPHPRAGRHARARDALLRRRRPLEGGDRGGGRPRPRCARRSSSSRGRSSRASSASGRRRTSRTSTAATSRRCSRRSSPGEEITRPEPVAETPVVDLMEALRRSVADVQGRRDAAKAATAKSREDESRLREGARDAALVRARRRRVRAPDAREVSACGRLPAHAWSCTWKRYLSILP